MKPLMQQYPTIDDLAVRSRKRLPAFSISYLEGGAGRETSLARNTNAFDDIELTPRYLTDVSKVSTKTTLFGRSWDQPFGIAPVGLCGIMWPGTEQFLATAAKRANIPYGLSIVATNDIESIGAITNDDVGHNGWFQMYTPVDPDIKKDVLERATGAGFDVLILTLDVPVPARRERQIRSGLNIPPRMDLRNIVQTLLHPSWALATAKAGLPRFRTLERYSFGHNLNDTMAFLNTQLTQPMTLDEIKRIRDLWPGKLVVKGIMHVDDAKQTASVGVDGIVVSNHGGRQIDSSPATVPCLPAIRQSVGPSVSVLLDSGVRSGLDVARALASGADFVLAGRPFLYGVTALGEPGADHAIQILSDELVNTMKQIGCVDTNDLDQRWLS